MTEQDTIKLLRECDAGISMGLSAIDGVIGYVEKADFVRVLTESREEHEKLGREVQEQLVLCREEGKEPNPVTKTMSQMMTELKLKLHESDKTIADLMTDGCNMGVNSLNRYLNQYTAADEYAKDIAKRLINLEEKLSIQMRDYL